MAQAEWLDGFVLHRRPYRETSYIVDFFTLQTGRISAVARGVRSNKSDRKGLLQPFRPLQMQVVGKSELKTLQKVEASGQSEMLTGMALFCGLYLNELTNRIMPVGLASTTIFAQYQRALSMVQDQQQIELTLRQFEFALLDEMGLLADYFHEGQTGSPIQADAWYQFSPDVGFTPCHDINSRYKLAGSAVLALGNQEWNESARRAAKLINRMALRSLLGDKPLKSRELFRR